MPKLAVPGRTDPSPVPPFLAARMPEIRPKQSATLDFARGQQTPEELQDAECVELELLDGVRLWVRTDDLLADLSTTATRSGDTIVLPRALPGRRRARGGQADVIIKGLKTFGIDIPEAIADYISRRVEAGMKPGGELLQCSSANAAAFSPPSKLDGRAPTLVFIHGTASSTEGSFGGLWQGPGSNRIIGIENPGARINDLFNDYGGRILALQHRTLSDSPIANVEALLQQLTQVLP